MYTTHFKYKASSTKRIGCDSSPFSGGTTFSPAAAMDCLFGDIAWALPNVDTEGVLATRKAVL